MNILVIGNGFDLAHGLPTRYTDFLNWIKEIEKIGTTLEWVDDIPFDEKEADKWLNNNNVPQEWIIKFDDEHIIDFLYASSFELRKEIIELNKNNIKEWFIEHNIELPEAHDYFMPTEYCEKIERALAIDEEEKIIKKETSIDSILELINRDNNQEERSIKFFFEKLKLRYTSSDSDKLNKEIYFLIKPESVKLIVFICQSTIRLAKSRKCTLIMLNKPVLM